MTAWIEQWHHDITTVAALPLPQELESPACMTGRLLRHPHRRLRQLAPRRTPRDCCDYHRQHWTFASETAIRLLHQAQAAGLTGEDAAERVTELAQAEHLPHPDVEAIECLVSTVDPLMLDDDGDIYGGRHRIQAMIDQGVPRTILLRLVLIDPDTGLPA